MDFWLILEAKLDPKTEKMAYNFEVKKQDEKKNEKRGNFDALRGAKSTEVVILEDFMVPREALEPSIEVRVSSRKGSGRIQERPGRFREGSARFRERWIEYFFVLFRTREREGGMKEGNKEGEGRKEEMKEGRKKEKAVSGVSGVSGCLVVFASSCQYLLVYVGIC